MLPYEASLEYGPGIAGSPEWLSVLRTPKILVYANGSQSGMILFRGHLTMSKDILIIMTGDGM